MKFLILSILSALLLSASDISQQVRILEKVVSEISLGEEIKIWSDDKNIIRQLNRYSKFEITTDCKDATCIILKDKKNLPKVCENTHIFALDYKLLSKIPQSFGALFWKKGRPNIVILEPRIKAQRIIISKNLMPYLEERVW